MPYTLWSRGRLLGESALDYRRVFPRHRMGDFHPTEAGEKVMPVATGVSRAGVDLVKTLSGSRPGGHAREQLRQTSEYADLAAAEDRCDALALELRGPDGVVIPTEWIDLRDTEFLLSLAEMEDLDVPEFSPEFCGIEDDDCGAPPLGLSENPFQAADFEEDDYASFEDEAPWRSERVFPRYQLQVMLREDASVP
ncbi:MAG: hypothetical protein ACT4PJ_01120 [Gemmatimonadaceae bacterium]